MDQYHVRLKGRCLGPYSLDRIRQMTRKGEVGRTHEVCTDGMSWAPATSFPEIFERPTEQSPVTHATAAVAPVAAGPGPVPASVPTNSEPQWYCDRNGSAHGPMSRARLLAMIQQGEVNATTFVFQEGAANWVLAGESAELAGAFQAGGAGGGQPGINAFCRECGAGVNQKAVMCPKCGAPTGAGTLPFGTQSPIQFSFPATTTAAALRRRSGEKKSKTVAAVLALLIGGFGIHHFYLGNAVLGIVYILFCWTLIPAIVACVEGIVFLTMSDAAFDDKYNS